MKTKVVIAMSGGVDSSVAAHFLVEQGYEVIGLFMRLGIDTIDTITRNKVCCSLEDANDARNVADQLGIPFHVLNFKDAFDRIIDAFCTAYLNGRTPNPCITCNQELKFGRLLDFAKMLNAGFIATGHYAKIEKSKDRYLLKRGADPRKDQSYVLFSLTQDQLSKTLFPLGAVTKEYVRQVARNLNLKTKDKPESQDICFVLDNNYHNLLYERFGNRIAPGFIKDRQGNTLGRHPGVPFFTIGQRKGLGIAFGTPRYVIDINPQENTVVIGAADELMENELVASGVNWISIDKPEEPLEVQAKIRYNHTPAPAIVYSCGPDKARVVFKNPQRAITPGQAVVFYHNDTVVGGGWIERKNTC
ncbi:MAG: tRNA 2-thiouridine(34) synthase MnmA [Candidatus Jettenia sp.]|uniref:tRNA-specific 2-thiouridylase MnmA n=1 Tax=Candidatus Jettenia caeni TaxID=247490 RepID=I3II88_9BACT|nr:tRNA 2-thiouridine(34) synthase MnmA [Candidatus Jettenia sp. AMX1]MBC6930048.1 tRNA 2-thiouridine(34) synthase MnmA [Candidatus Jettenia sp.]NUN23345.1 tRNA 2-thiouridine(34) synthase MnmA [Candidatus Jettenia caeni]KAA0248175.1 MAG: tRNA 2-thiouridine(34) synthase MnmA [Candidatus Jettenia sp. AMX1]MCE7881726.1 tRNA 2-thiouridine(34) synthase MnmA [Candidatus Jettenia sp. AMX1]MCQ3928351.1 tRNA 2-thiouridine(34) synthase MnmA [Candidatus Jettenia sp.]